MRKSALARVLAFALATLMIAGMVPVVAFASDATLQSADFPMPDSLTYASSTETPLAPGVTETTVVAYDKKGDRVQYFVVNANIATTDTVEVKANYHDNDNTGNWGKATVVEQANAAKAKRGYNVVASTNASYYNVSTGQPTGGFVMEGININGNSTGNGYPFFAVLKDGTAMIGEKGTFSQYADQIQEAVGGWSMLVWDGKIVSGTNNVDKYPRSTVGVKANGDVVLMLADGNNKPYSAGLTKYEQAEVMLSLGCVAAVELDGGGSATYAAKLEGTDEVVVRNVCCDGTVRSVSNTLMVISTAVADGTFDHANLSTEYAYYAPTSQVAIKALGADLAGGAAEIPADVTWALADDSFGTVENGIFTSNGKLGTATVQMLYNGAVVGSVNVNIINPTSIAFSAADKTVPYGRTSDFSVTAMYNGAEVHLPAGALNFTVSAGEMLGYIYSAPTDETIKNATVTATYKYADLGTIQVNVTFGKGSDILEDFEDADISEWGDYFDMVEAEKNGLYNGGYTVIYQSEGASSGNLVERGICEDVFLASRENGDPVYSGDYSLGYTLDYTQSVAHANWQYAYLYYLGDVMTYRDVEKGINGTRLGMWMYIPEEAVGLCARLSYTYETAPGKLNTAYLYFTYQYVEKGFSKLTSEKIPEAGWAYVYCDLDAISTTYVTSSYYKDENGNYTRAPESNYAPAFIQFIVSSSATGAEKCTVYIDDITLDYSDVVDDRDAPIISDPLVLDDLNNYKFGTTVNFNTLNFTASVADDTSHGTNFTGLDTATAQIYVDGQKVNTTYSAGKIATAGVVLPNGVHDVTFEIADKQGNYTKLTKQITVAAESEQPVITVTGAPAKAKADGKLYTGSQYNLMINTDKVEAIKSITTKIWLNSASKWALEHMDVLHGFEVSYELNELACTAELTITRVGDVAVTGAATLVSIPVYAWAWDGSAGHDSTYQWNNQGCAPQTTVSYKVKYGEVTYMKAFAVNNANFVAGFGNVRQDVKTELDSSIANLKKTIGIWHSHTEVAVDDLAATCTEDGFHGRTKCSVCESILNWGVVDAATGHTYAVQGDELYCHCGEQAENGFVTNSNGDVYYLIAGKLQSGWTYDIELDGFYYFSPVDYKAVDGIQTIDGRTYEFENLIQIDGHWEYTAKGPKLYWAGQPHARGWRTIKGKTYHFTASTSGIADVGVVHISTSVWGGETLYYLFDEYGALVRMLDGIYEDVYYYEGHKTPYLGLIELDGDYYYVADYAKIVRGVKKYVNTTNDLTWPDGTPIAKGYYEFDADGKMIAKNGPNEDGYFYKNGAALKAYQLVEYNGDYYFIGDYNKYVTNKSVSLTKARLDSVGLTELPAGTYAFGADGKMVVVIPEPKNGPQADGFFYVNDVKQTGYKLLEYNGNYYFVGDYNKYAVNKTVSLSKTRLAEAGLDLVAGKYYFDAEGKLVIPEPKNGPQADGFFYINDVKQTGYKLLEYNGNYYFVGDYNKYAVNKFVTLTRARLDEAGLTDVPAGKYEFDAEGKMIIVIPEPKNGPQADGTFYINDVKQAGYKLVEYNGDYYFVGDYNKYIVNKTQYLSVARLNAVGLDLPAGNYQFDSTGKLVLPVDRNGLVDGFYYVDNVVTPDAGLIFQDGYYYYIIDEGRPVVGKSYYVSKLNDLVWLDGTPVTMGTYTFDAEGRLVTD